jgi:hypothetical protein
MPIEARKDTEKEDRYAVVKAKWDEAPGSSKYQKAQAARERWLETTRTGELKPLAMTDGSEQMIADEQITKMAAALQESLVTWNAQIEMMATSRDREKDAAGRFRDDFDRSFRKRQADSAAWAASHTEARSAYNKEKARQEAAAQLLLQQQLEAKRQQELAEQQALQQQQAQAQQAEQTEAAVATTAAQEQISQKPVVIEVRTPAGGRSRRSRGSKS